MSDPMTRGETKWQATRREFLGSAGLTAAGAAVGLSAYYLRRRAPDTSGYAPVKIGYIGVGNRGLALMRSSLQVPGNQPVAVCDARPAQVEFAINDIRTAKEDEKYPVKVYSDYRKLLDDPEVEAVFIATPHYLHGPMAIDAIHAGKHVYCEKAMAYTIGENWDLYRLVKAKEKLVFQVGHQRHYSPLYREVVRRIEADEIGEVVAVRAQWNKNDEVRRPCPDPALEKLVNWRLYSEYSGGLTTEFASHQIDVANWVLGTHPDSVCGYGGIDWFEDNRDTTDNIHLIFNYKVPIVARDEYGRVQYEADGTTRKMKTGPDGRPLFRNVRFSYVSVMQNAHLGPSELVLGQYGTFEVSLLGGESFKEEKERPDPEKKKVVRATVKAGSTVRLTEGGLPRKYGQIIEAKIEPNHWVHFTKPIAGAYDKEETLLAVHSFLECIRKSARGEDFSKDLKADVTVGLWGAVPALMANIAMREERTVYWSEFAPDGVA